MSRQPVMLLYIIYSLLGHAGVVYLLMLVPIQEKPLNNFLVFGVHSYKDMHTSFTPLFKPSSQWRSVENTSVIKKQERGKANFKKKDQSKKNLKKDAKVVKGSSVELKKTAAKIEKNKNNKKINLEKPQKKKKEAKQEVEEQKDIVSSEAFDTNESIEVVNNAEVRVSNFDFAVYEKDIQDAVSQVWAPPVGVPKGTECIIEVSIDGNGNVVSFEIIEACDVLVYQMSILQIIWKIKFGKRFYGKIIPICFRQ